MDAAGQVMMRSMVIAIFLLSLYITFLSIALQKGAFKDSPAFTYILIPIWASPLIVVVSTFLMKRGSCVRRDGGYECATCSLPPVSDSYVVSRAGTLTSRQRGQKRLCCSMERTTWRAFIVKPVTCTTCMA